MTELTPKYRWHQCAYCGKLFDSEEALHEHERRCMNDSNVTLFVH
jgi:hypothetical protein